MSMNIASDTRERVGTSTIADAISNTYYFSQEKDKPVSTVRVETAKDGNKVCNANYESATNRLFITITDYKYLTTEERVLVLNTMLHDIDSILTESQPE